MSKFWSDYPIIEKEIDAVSSIIAKNAKCKDKVIESSILDLLNSGGKMLRPAFTIIASKFGNYNEERSRALASVMEMFHMATLVHDDIIDEAEFRRGKETVQSKYGKNYAVYIGDFLFCLCFRVLATTSSIERGIDVDTQVMSRICLGEIEQLNSRFDKNVSVKDYLKRTSGKTAELFSLSLYIGAAESSCDKKICRLFWNIGHNIGMAFQIIDDILDYTATDEELGKKSGNDLKEGIYTLPLILAMKKNPSVFENILNKDNYSNEEIDMIINIVKNNNGIDDAMKIANKYSQKAFRDINKLPDNEYRDILLGVVTKLLERSY
ncbi:polyprenyl synthetase family protein [Romboutsia weinsteinii]|uniref:Polyprenyl synthetase family protein n=1 Tax=Romboutsia weinsteinii TaxID=2020949 RepID=A0A371IY52_9FIRM|nr:polyprenyl synthetase family protein [Romboutsia weinsteinii]RDY25417.1 polyprenyl synthetase family protein [Romboutsia weinsteinii]